MLGLFGAGKPDHPLADPKEARRLLGELPANDPLKALEDLAHWHESVWAAPGLKPEQRVAALLAVDDAAQPRVRKLAKDYFAAERPSRFQENRLWMHAHEYWRQAGAAFSRCIEAFVREPKAWEPVRTQLLTLVLRALRSLAQQLKWMHLRYGPVDAAVWGMLNNVYALAEARGLAEAKGAPYAQSAESTPRLEYLRAAVFAASSPDSLLPREVELAERLIADLAPGFRYATQPDGAGLTYWVDLAKPMPPMRMGRSPLPSGSVRCFGGGAALSALQGLIQKIEGLGHVPAEVSLGAAYEPEAALDVMQHLAMYWSPVPPERRHPRHSVKTRLAIVQGFDSVLQVLGPEDATSFTRPVEEAWIVENVSAGGFGAAVPQIKGDWLKVGALLGMQPEGGANWLVGVVRRVTKLPGQQARVGIQTLSRAPAAVTLRMADADVPALVLGGDAGSAETRIALRPAVFAKGVQAQAERAGRLHMYMPQEVTEKGDDYEIARFREMIRES